MRPCRRVSTDSFSPRASQRSPREAGSEAGEKRKAGVGGCEGRAESGGSAGGAGRLACRSGRTWGGGDFQKAALEGTPVGLRGARSAARGGSTPSRGSEQVPPRRSWPPHPKSGTIASALETGLEAARAGGQSAWGCGTRVGLRRPPPAPATNGLWPRRAGEGKCGQASAAPVTVPRPCSERSAFALDAVGGSAGLAALGRATHLGFPGTCRKMTMGHSPHAQQHRGDVRRLCREHFQRCFLWLRPPSLRSQAPG